MLNVFVQLGDFQSVKPLFSTSVFQSAMYIFRAWTCFSFSSLLLTDLIDTLQLRQVLNVILHQFFVYKELGGKFCDSIRCINWQLPLLEEPLNIWLWLPIIGNTLLAIFIIISKSMTLKYLNSGSADWSRIGLGILSVAGPVQAISSGPSVTQQCLHNKPSFLLHDPFNNSA